ncbi:MAG: DEAD/DEAH box helicase family protein, partial [Bacteroidales bacterium]|nr:DEAD/DEAH box helicase family protein [Bacteroidales bacterium]
MKVELFPFQRKACDALRGEVADALGSYQKRGVPQVISFTAPTGAGKTIIMASLVEKIFCGDDNYMDQPEAIFVWLSDSPQLNEQSKLKMETKADRIKIGQCVTVEDDSFDQEMLDDGHIYFLNTQKLGGGSNLVKRGDSRTYTIWETLANTVREKSDRLYFIIDEAHRGMQGREAGIATTIMQKFIKGSVADDIPPMPVVVGMSATTQRFNDLVKGIGSTTIRICSVSPEEVRSSGLLKDRIIIKYPEGTAVGSEMTVLYAAADDWREKWVHWEQYCREQHYAYVNPIFVVQVQNGNERVISETNLDDCLRIIEERSGVKFKTGEVVHTFGQTDSAIIANGLEINYVEPSRVSDDMRIKVVFFKENLSTGWDCPRAETMMSFRRAVDATYIAQLLGRMVRTPMQMHVQVDDVLNDVHLYLPHFDENTVSKVVNELQNSEGGNIPTEVEGEKLDSPLFETWTTQISFDNKLEQPSSEHSGHGGGQSPQEKSCEQAVSPSSVQSSEENQQQLDVVEQHQSNGCEPRQQ